MGPIARRWWVVPVFVILGVLGGFIATAIVTPTYQSTSQVLLTPTTAQDGTTPLGSNDYAIGRTRAYASIAGGEDFRRRVVGSLGVPDTSGYPQFAIGAQSGTTLLNVTAVDTSGERAQRTVEIIDGLLTGQVEKLNGQTAGTPPIRADVVSPPIAPSVPFAPSRVTFVSLGALAGIVLGLAFAYALGRIASRPAEGPVVQRVPGSEPGPSVTGGHRNRKVAAHTLRSDEHTRHDE